ncbi:MAG: DUF3006 domain-containing protein [Clostridia bacterium]|nr:DUF3006 domain-containing protein [Clostridia bacterium]
MHWTVDRIEEGFAVLITDTGEVFSVPASALGPVAEGDVLSVLPDPEETERRRQAAETMLRSLFSTEKP